MEMAETTEHVCVVIT